MNKKADTEVEVMPVHKNIAAALAAAQLQMGRAVKDAKNTHFKNKYADLASVMDACMSALNRNGIAVIQPTMEDEIGRYVETRLIHADSGDSLACRVPLIIAKNDMQGYGSAVTYARRYGLMSMAGIAPEDDDGNAAAKSQADNAAWISKAIADAKRAIGKEVDLESLAGLWQSFDPRCEVRSIRDRRKGCPEG